jgi:hypothetical protein
MELFVRSSLPEQGQEVYMAVQGDFRMYPELYPRKVLELL